MKSAFTTVLVTGATVAGVAGVLVLNPTRSALTTTGVDSAGSSQLGAEPGTGTQGQAPQYGSGSLPQGGQGGEGFGGPQGFAPPGSVDDESESDTGSDTSSSSGSSSSGSSGSSNSSATGTSYTGSAYQSPYGPMQVSITVDGTRITGIQWTQIPMNDGHSYRINSYAAPLLVEEAMSAQSASVSAVSGASYTTQGFKTSLASAIKKAGL